MLLFWGFSNPRHPTVPALFVAKTILSLRNHPCTLLKISCHRYVSLFLDYYSGPLICLSLSMPIIHCLDNCGFIVSTFCRKQLWSHLALELLCGKISVYQILLIDKALLRLSISCMNFGSLCLLRNPSFLFVNLSCSYYFLIILLISVEFIIMSSPSLLSWLISSFFFFFSWSLWLEIYQFQWPSQRSNLGLIDFSVWNFCFLFHWFLP